MTGTVTEAAGFGVGFAAVAALGGASALLSAVLLAGARRSRPVEPAEVPQ